MYAGAKELLSTETHTTLMTKSHRHKTIKCSLPVALATGVFPTHHVYDCDGGGRGPRRRQVGVHVVARAYTSVQSLLYCIQFSSHHEARVASRLPSSAATESRLGCSDAADAVADVGIGDAIPSGIRCGRSRLGSVFRHRRAVFLQSTVDCPKPTTVFGVPSSPWSAAAFTRQERLSVPLLRGWPSAKVVFPSSGDAVAFAAAISAAAQP